LIPGDLSGDVDRNLLVRALRRPQVRAVAGTAGLNLLTTALGSAGGIFLARALGPANRGDLAIILQWPALLGSLASFGTTQATCYWISKEKKDAPAIIGTAAAVALVTGVVVAVVGLALAPLIARSTQVERGLVVLFVLSPAFIGGGVWMSSLQALDIKRWNLSRAVQPLAYFAALLSLWLLGELTLTTAVASVAGALLLQTVYAWTQAPRAVGASLQWRAAELRRLYGYGWKVWLSSAPQMVNVRVDLLVLSVVGGVSAAEIGNYAVAASLSWLALPMSIAFGSVAFPRIAAAAPGAAARIERISIGGAALAAGFTVSALAVGAPFVIPRLFGAGFQDAVVALWILAPGTICLAVNRVVADLLQGRGRPLRTSACEGVGAIATVILIALLIPPFGIRGAAAASSVAYALVMVLLLLAISKVRRDAELSVRA
jgi:O-antigen/teichoic acid export membrane protein